MWHIRDRIASDYLPGFAVGAVRPLTIRSRFSMGAYDIPRAQRRAQELIDAGFTTIKVKVGGPAAEHCQPGVVSVWASRIHGLLDERQEREHRPRGQGRAQHPRRLPQLRVPGADRSRRRGEGRSRAAHDRGARVIVIGTGPAGEGAAMMLAKSHRKVAVVEVIRLRVVAGIRLRAGGADDLVPHFSNVKRALVFPFILAACGAPFALSACGSSSSGGAAPATSS